MLVQLRRLSRTRSFRAASVLATGALITGVAWTLLSSSEATSLDKGEFPFESITRADIAAHELDLRLATADTLSTVAIGRDEIREIAESRGAPLKEDPQLVVLGNPLPLAPETQGPVWAVIPDRPAVFTEPVAEGTETWVLQLFDPQTGRLLVELGGGYADSP